MKFRYKMMISLLVAATGWQASAATGCRGTAEDGVSASGQYEARLDELLAQMETEMGVIYATSDPDARAARLATHQETMREAMNLVAVIAPERMHSLMTSHLEAAGAPNLRTLQPHMHKRYGARPAAERRQDQTSRLAIRAEMLRLLMDDMARFTDS